MKSLAFSLLLFLAILWPPTFPAPQQKLIRYSDQTSSPRAVREAMSAWSKEIGVRWQASPARSADVIFRLAPVGRIEDRCQELVCLGWASAVGNKEGPTIILSSGELWQAETKAIFVHELGHFFGLQHQSGCNVMRARGIPGRECLGRGSLWSGCKLLLSSRRQLRSLYGLDALPKKNLICKS